ncbi:hypothetical protein L1987_21968 [Smallanthus sonchifolius]|uniref:Uncharacterized protein n=1 Tax=Smallanthus sonchifolius TaxID=185202 RepID=A0ACB9IE63_9ASTR|nr:hypothetical protein L1987_21968 [Smallanthus sonchifolius]
MAKLSPRNDLYLLFGRGMLGKLERRTPMVVIILCVTDSTHATWFIVVTYKFGHSNIRHDFLSISISISIGCVVNIWCRRPTTHQIDPPQSTTCK